MEHRSNRKQPLAQPIISRKLQKARVDNYLFFCSLRDMIGWARVFFFSSGDASLLQIHICGTTSTCGFLTRNRRTLHPFGEFSPRVLIKNIPCSCPCYDDGAVCVWLSNLSKPFERKLYQRSRGKGRTRLVVPPSDERWGTPEVDRTLRLAKGRTGLVFGAAQH